MSFTRVSVSALGKHLSLTAAACLLFHPRAPSLWLHGTWPSVYQLVTQAGVDIGDHLRAPITHTYSTHIHTHTCGLTQGRSGAGDHLRASITSHTHTLYKYTQTGTACVAEGHRWPPQSNPSLHTSSHTHTHTHTHTHAHTHTHTHTQRLGFSKQRVFPLTVKGTPRWPNALLT